MSPIKSLIQLDVRSMIDRLRGASDWPKTAAQAEAALRRFEERKRELEAIVNEEESRDLERSFANPRVNGSKTLIDAQLELNRMARKIQLVTAERDELRDKEAAADYQRLVSDSHAKADACRERAARIDAIETNLVAEMTALANALRDFDRTVPSKDGRAGVNVGAAVRSVLDVIGGDRFGQDSASRQTLQERGRGTMAETVEQHLQHYLRACGKMPATLPTEEEQSHVSE
jgi:exonuclease VII small subunit